MHTAAIAYRNSYSSINRWKIMTLGLVAFLIAHLFSTSLVGDCVVSLGSFGGQQYTTKETIGRKCLVESKWMRVMQHKVSFPGSMSPISDWLWIDYHDRVNVLVEAPETAVKLRTTGTTPTDRQFYVFQQSKYALEGRTSLAIIGGIIEPGELPEIAAAREVSEEMSVVCDEIHPLGRFRTDVNRGMGWVHSFLATSCHSASKRKRAEGDYDGRDQVGTVDVERQDLRILSLRELQTAARNGDFLEVQWSNTVALALLHPELIGLDSTRDV